MQGCKGVRAQRAPLLSRLLTVAVLDGQGDETMDRGRPKLTLIPGP